MECIDRIVGGGFPAGGMITVSGIWMHWPVLQCVDWGIAIQD